MTVVLLVCFLGLQAAFIWARYAIFRIVGATPPAVRFIDASATTCIVAGSFLMARRAGDDGPLDLLALAAAACSAVMFGWALRGIRPRQLTAAFSPDAPVELLRTGAFRFVRNPFYLSYMLAYTLPWIVSRSWWGTVLTAYMAAIYVRATLVEERKFMAGPLAGSFRIYARDTGRFFPRPSWRARLKGDTQHGR